MWAGPTPDKELLGDCQGGIQSHFMSTSMVEEADTVDGKVCCLPKAVDRIRV